MALPNLLLLLLLKLTLPSSSCCCSEQVAVKRIRKSKYNDLAKTEALTLMSLRHAHIVGIQSL